MGGFARGVVRSFSFCFGPTYLGLSSFRAWATTNAKNPLNSLGYYWPQKSYDLLHSNNEVVFRRSYLCLISNLLNYMQVEFETVNESYMVHMYFIFKTAMWYFQEFFSSCFLLFLVSFVLLALFWPLDTRTFFFLILTSISAACKICHKRYKRPLKRYKTKAKIWNAMCTNKKKKKNAKKINMTQQ